MSKLHVQQTIHTRARASRLKIYMTIGTEYEYETRTNHGTQEETVKQHYHWYINVMTLLSPAHYNMCSQKYRK